MFISGRSIFWTSILVVGLAYYFSVPPYEGYEETLRLRFWLSIFKAIGVLSQAGAAIGVGDVMDLLNMQFKLMMQMMADHQYGSLQVENTVFDGIPVRIYVPESKENGLMPAVVYFHGGGWVIGSVDTVNSVSRRIANDLPAVVVSVDYRLAPEFPFPIPFDDCVTATKHLFSNADKYGVDPNRIAVAGDSAGGGLTAAVSLKLREHSPPLKLQVLINPALQAIDLDTPSYQANAHDTVQSKRMMAVFYAAYAQGHYKNVDVIEGNEHVAPDVKKRMAISYINHDDIESQYKKPPYKQPNLDSGDEALWSEIQDTMLNPYFAPSVAENLTGLPPAIVQVCGKDPLRDEGILYSQRLKKAGNDVTFLHFKHSFHAFIYFADQIKRAEEDFNTIIKAMRGRL